MPTKEDLRYFQALPLDMKIGLTKNRIRDWVREYGESGVYVSFSGGKDSTVLLHIVREMYPDIEAVFVNTGLEYPEIQKFVKTFDNVTILRPKMRFDEVIKKYGYPLIGKRQANSIDLGRKNIKDNKYSFRLLTLGIKPSEALEMGLELPPEEMLERYKKTKEGTKYNIPKYQPLLFTDFETSAKCCDVMKKQPLKAYEKQTGKRPIMATMTSESMLRESTWLKNGCNAFDAKEPKSAPMSFWTEQDVLQYIKLYIQPRLFSSWIKASLEHGRSRKRARKYLKKINYRKTAIASVYGDIVYLENPEQMRFEEMGVKGCGTEKLKTTGCDRTGCIFCAFGCHLEKESRFQRLKQTHPRQYEFCIGGGEFVWEGTAYTSSGEPREISWINDDDSPMSNEEIEEFVNENKNNENFKFVRIWQPNKKGLGMGHVFDELNKIYGDGFIKY